MKKEKSLEFLIKNIYEIEKKLNLFEKEIHNIHFWELIRSPFYIMLAEKYLNYNYLTYEKEVKPLRRLKYVLKSFYNTYRNGFIKSKRKTDIILFQFRKKEVNNKFIDMYTYKLNDIFESNNLSYELVEENKLGKHKEKPSRILKYDDYFSFEVIAKKIFMKIHLTDQEENLIHNIEAEVKFRFGIDISLKNVIIKNLQRYLILKNIYKKTLEKKKVKLVFFANHSGKEPLISACKELKVKTIEIQHGVISKDHIGYNYPDNTSLRYSPDYFFLWGKYWKNTFNLPINKENIKIIGFPYFFDMKKKYENVKKNKNQILFISQGTVGKYLYKIAYSFAKKNPSFKIFYKLHPKEIEDNKKKEYNQNTLTNMEILYNEDTDLYYYLATSQYLISHNSTVVFEGLSFGCKTILINLPGLEYMEYLIKGKYVLLANNENEIKKLIKQDDFIDFDNNLFFQDFNNKIIEFIKGGLDNVKQQNDINNRWNR